MLATVSSKTQNSDIYVGLQQNYILKQLGLVWINVTQDVFLLDVEPTEL